MTSTPQDLYRLLPGVGEVLERAEVARLVAAHGRASVTEATRVVLAELRARIREGVFGPETLELRLAEIAAGIEQQLVAQQRPRLRRVINATGVILQTNLGRAPLSALAVKRVTEVASGYCNLEFDLEAGQRSRRDELVEELILRAVGLDAGASDGAGLQPAHAEDGWGAAVVNNCAAATFLALNTLADGGEVIVSRGELVEIGGGFRVPEILAKSGGMLREVGTTNKTRVADYTAAIGPETRLILRVHRSNFEIYGFTEQPTLEQLAAAGQQAGVPVFEDQGTGCLLDLRALGLPDQPSLQRSVGSGVSLVAASGDKLLGGPQCGLLVGRADLIARIRANPLFRALRVDKMVYAALEATLEAYVFGREDDLPVVQMLRVPAEAVRERCERWVECLCRAGIAARVVPTQSVVGGGTTPGATLPSFAVTFLVEGLSETALAGQLRALELPIVCRVSEGRVLLDLRTVAERDDAEVLSLLQRHLAAPEGNG